MIRAALLTIAVLGAGAHPRPVAAKMPADMESCGSKIGVGDDVPRSRNRTVVGSGRVVSGIHHGHQGGPVPLGDRRTDRSRAGRSWSCSAPRSTARCAWIRSCASRSCRRSTVIGSRSSTSTDTRTIAVWVEWGVTGEPWTFLVDARGKVSERVPGTDRDRPAGGRDAAAAEGRGVAMARCGSERSGWRCC